MTGPEHFREAERLLELAKHPQRVVAGVDQDAVIDMSKLSDQIFMVPNGSEVVDSTLAAAQVHALLANAAATMETVASRGPGDISSGWQGLLWPVSGDPS